MQLMAADAPVIAQVGDRYAQPQHLKGVPKEVILYQYEVCPFCCKVKAFLDFHKVPRPRSPPMDFWEPFNPTCVRGQCACAFRPCMHPC